MFRPSALRQIPSIRTIDNEQLAEIIREIKINKGKCCV